MNDHDVVELSLFLGDLVSINLSECSMLTYSTMFALVRNYPSLSEAKMEHTSLGGKCVDNSNSSMDCVLNHQLKLMLKLKTYYIEYSNLMLIY
jgi:hypothetical protein